MTSKLGLPHASRSSFGLEAAVFRWDVNESERFGSNVLGFARHVLVKRSDVGARYGLVSLLPEASSLGTPSNLCMFLKTDNARQLRNSLWFWHAPCSTEHKIEFKQRRSYA